MLIISIIIYIVSIVIIVICVRYYDSTYDNTDHLVVFMFCPVLNTLAAIIYIYIIISICVPNLNDALYKLIKYGRKS